ncbi:MAG: hypothetical protein ACRDDX_03120 [Cellulosilyticaceae bacterium]
MIIVKSVQTPHAVVGEEITYQVAIWNDASYSIEDILVSDSMNEHIKFIQGSLYCNNIQRDEDIIAGIKIEALSPGMEQGYMIQYKVKILSAPLENELSSQTNVTYAYQEPLTNKRYLMHAESNVCYLSIYTPFISVESKQDKAYGSIGDQVTYQINLTNKGDLDFINVRVQNTFSPGLELVLGSVYLDDKNIHLDNLGKGINIQAIKVGDTRNLTYQVIIQEGSSDLQLVNETQIIGTYLLPDDTIGMQTFQSNILAIDNGMRCFRQELIDKYLILPKGETAITEIDAIEASIDIQEYYMVNIPTGLSLDGSRLTGTQMMVNSILKIEVSYMSGNERGMHYIQYALPFHTAIMLPRHYNSRKLIKVNGEVANVQYVLESTQGFYISCLVEILAMVIE